MPKLEPNSRSSSRNRGSVESAVSSIVRKVKKKVKGGEAKPLLRGSPAHTTYGATPESILDERGKLTSKIVDVNRVAFRVLAWYYSLVDLSWRRLLMWTCIAYISLNVVGACVYYLMCLSCGVKSITAIGAFYFNVVTIAGNGGYEGEDPIMLTPGHSCYTARSILVVIESFIGASFASVMTALFVSRASRASSLRHRIVFSDVATVNQNEETQEWELSFRIANATKRAVIESKLQLFLNYRVRLPGRAGDAGAVTMRTEELSWTCLEEEHTSDSQALLLWFPVTIVHKIQKDSPLSYFTRQAATNGVGPFADALKQMEPQVIPVLSTSDANSGSSMQARRCYNSSLVIDGYYSDSSTTKISPSSGKVIVDLGSFNHVAPVLDRSSNAPGGSGWSPKPIRLAEEEVDIPDSDTEFEAEEMRQQGPGTGGQRCVVS